MYFPILGRCWAILGGPKIEKISKKIFFLESIQNSLKRILTQNLEKKFSSSFKIFKMAIYKFSGQFEGSKAVKNG